MTPIQFAVLILWAFFALGAIIHVNVEAALRGRNIGHAENRPLNIAEIIAGTTAAISGGLLWWWIA